MPSRPTVRPSRNASLRATALSRSRAGRLALAWLLLCLVLVPMWGQFHHVAHGGPAWQGLAAHAGLHAHHPGHADGSSRSHGHAHAHPYADAAVADSAEQGGASLPGGRLASHAAADCQLLDQLALADALHLAAAPVSAASRAAATHPGGTLGRPTQPPALFEARAPPQA